MIFIYVCTYIYLNIMAVLFIFELKIFDSLLLDTSKLIFTLLGISVIEWVSGYPELSPKPLTLAEIEN